MKKLTTLLFTFVFLFSSSCFAEVQWGGSISRTGTNYLLDANCVFAAYMDSSSGEELDRSSNGINMTYGNTPISSNDVEANFKGKSIQFVKTDEDYLTNSTGLNITGDMTVSFKMKRDSDIFSRVIGEHDVTSSGQYGWNITTSSSGLYRWGLYISSGGSDYQGANQN